MGKIKDITGLKFGKWLVLSLSEERKKNRIAWLCRCDCGKEKVLIGSYLKSGKLKGCHCDDSMIGIDYRAKHGRRNTPEYNSWQSMKKRCYDPTNENFKHYGGRGIIVCDRWIDSFENFFKDMGIKPSLKHTIDRIDTNGNYSLENCKWSTPIEQGNNKRNCIILTMDSKQMTLKQACVMKNIPSGLVYNRVQHGWSIEEALNTPRMRQYSRVSRKSKKI